MISDYIIGCSKFSGILRFIIIIFILFIYLFIYLFFLLLLLLLFSIVFVQLCWPTSVIRNII